jgi:ribonuclease HII
MTTPAPSNLFRFENQARERGFNSVVGIDEVGRGPLAGPVVAAAVVFLSQDDIPNGLNDSKKLSVQDRIRIADELHASESVVLAIGQVDPKDIDELNILRATFRAMLQAFAGIRPPTDFALVDGNAVPAELPCPAKAVIKGDSLSASIAAASILAKVHRDQLMTELDTKFPQYGFAEHKGYGTASHLEALNRHGPCPVHRKSFAPVARLIAPGPEQMALEL